MAKEAIVVGAGLVGSLWTLMLSRKGYKVKVYERREDIRNVEKSAGKSINLALSDRGWKALDLAGIKEKVEEIIIPMYGRRMHNEDGELTFLPYGKENQAINSISRADLNALLLDEAEKAGDVQISFNERCIAVDFDKNEVTFQHSQTNKISTDTADIVFGTDGAFSAVRYEMQKTPRFNYQQEFLQHGYRELLMPANEDGSYKMDINALHIWPRGQFMLIALPNMDGSFTCTLFMPYEGKNSFHNLKTDEEVKQFFQKTFPDFYELMPDVVQDFKEHPLSDLAIIKCYPWTYKKTAILGDAAHAVVPFYGQGMNAGFEDCSMLWNLMEAHNEDWETIFKTFQEQRKPDGDGIADLSVQNYIEMRDLVADPMFLLRKKIEKKIYEKYPEKWIPLYTQVTFSDIPYSKALAAGKRQDEIMDKVMQLEDIESKWNSDEVEQMIMGYL